MRKAAALHSNGPEATGIWHIGFRLCDKMAIQLAVVSARLERDCSSVWRYVSMNYTFSESVAIRDNYYYQKQDL